MSVVDLPLFEDVDVLQVGARNMQNFDLLRELGKQGLAVYHRFENSPQGLPALPEGCKVVATFGQADRDFSAQAWLYEKG